MEGKKDEMTFGTLIKKGFYSKIVIIGFPYDEGAILSGSKKGSKYGPDSFRRFLLRVGTITNAEYGTDLKSISICDYGNIIPPSGFPTIEESYKKLKVKITLNFQRLQLPIIIGGSKDYVEHSFDAFTKFYGESSTLIYICPYIDMKTCQGECSVMRRILKSKAKSTNVIIFGLSDMNEMSEVNEAKELGIQIVYQSQFKSVNKTTNLSKAGQLFKEILDSSKSDSIYLSFTMESLKVLELSV